MKVSSIEDLADRKRSVEIGLVGASQGQSADEHGAWIAWIEIVGHFCGNGDSVGGATGTKNVCRSTGWIGQVHSRKLARSSGSHVAQARAGFEGHLRICAGIQRNVIDGPVGQRPSPVRWASSSPAQAS